MSIIASDFNAHHNLLSTKGRDNPTGKNLAASLFTFLDLCLSATPDLHSYYHVPTRSYSTFDLCFLSSELFAEAHLELLYDLGGDRSPNKLSLNFSHVTVKVKTRYRWVFGPGVDWNALRQASPFVNSSNI